MSRIPNYPPPGGWGWEGPKKQPSESASDSHLNAIKNEANAMKGFESTFEHAERLYHEVLKILNHGIQSDSEAVMLLAKLDIAIEASNDTWLKAAAKEMQRDIKIRYPNLPIEDSKR